MKKYDFSRLTPLQKELLTRQGWTLESSNAGQIQPGESTVKKLIERGLVISRKRGDGYLTFIEYDVPLDVHMAWCEHCSKYFKDEGQS